MAAQEKKPVHTPAIVNELVEALLVALPYVTDAEDVRDFRRGVVTQHVRQIRKALAKAGVL